MGAVGGCPANFFGVCKLFVAICDLVVFLQRRFDYDRLKKIMNENNTVVEIQQELTVRGEPVERLYSSYLSKRYLVNRRYQRKLIWSLEEKQNFIDSLIEGFPIPIILLAEPRDRADGTLELIDGMQRMNAITSFIANEFPVRDCYFDLNTFATTKDLLDKGLLVQKEPVLPRDNCISIASYPVPLSIYEFAEGESVDEVFRRINSGGRQLSRQELRTAGATNAFADCVRNVSASVRGDASNSDLVRLNDMKALSITNRELDYGIVADDVFWVSNSILTKDQLRQSRDEELVADLIAYMVSDEPVASRAELFDDYFGASTPLEGVKLERFKGMDEAIRRRTGELVTADFSRVMDAIVLTLERCGQSFSELLFADNNNGNPVPRYFQSVFLAFHQLIVRDLKIVADRELLIDRLRDRAKSIQIQEGGRWGAENRGAAVNTVIGLIQDAFEDDTAPDPAKVHWVTKLQNLLMGSKTEQAAYDFKQGFLTLSDTPGFDEGSFQKILETCVAIANIGRGHKGYVIIGVAETAETASRVEALFKVHPKTYNGFHVTGVEHEAAVLGKNLDQLFQEITNRVHASDISEPLKSYIYSHVKSVSYYDKTVYVFEIVGQDNPSLMGTEFFERRGAQVTKIPAQDLGGLFARFK